MATSKTPSKKRTTTKSTKAASKTSSRKRVGSKRSAKNTKFIGLQAEDRPFLTFRLTRQSLYWAVLGLVVIVFTVWIMKLQADIQSIYDDIDMNSNTTLTEPLTKHDAKQ